MTESNASVMGYAAAISRHEPLPALDEQYSLEQAYELQHSVTARISPGGAGGVKLGVTNPQAQAFFRLITRC